MRPRATARCTARYCNGRTFLASVGGVYGRGKAVSAGALPLPLPLALALVRAAGCCSGRWRCGVIVQKGNGGKAFVPKCLFLRHEWGAAPQHLRKRGEGTVRPVA